MSEAIGLCAQLPGTRISKVWTLWLPTFSMSGPGQLLVTGTSVSPWRWQPTQVTSFEGTLTIQGKSHYSEIRGAVLKFLVRQTFRYNKHCLQLAYVCDLENFILFRKEYFAVILSDLSFHVMENVVLKKKKIKKKNVIYFPLVFSVL